MTVNAFSAGSPAGAGSASSAAPTPRLSILIIDDNFDYADSLRYLLQLCGHDADVALNGSDGLRLATAGLYDAIVCDIGLPEISGYEVARRLREERATAGVPLVAVTGYGSPEAKRQSFTAGFDAHLVKPAAVGEILSALGVPAPNYAA